MKAGTPNLLTGTALPPTVLVPVRDGPGLPSNVRLDTDETGRLHAVVDLTEVPRHQRRKALRRFRRVGATPEPVKNRKPPSKRTLQADTKEDAMALEILGHEWARERGNRSIAKERRGNKLWVIGRVACSVESCPNVSEQKSHGVVPGNIMDKRLQQKGWKLDPPICPDHARHNPKEEIMATQAPPVTSQAATMAQAKVFKLLAIHFDIDKGRYANGYSDQRIGTETGVAIAAVALLRKECFGEIREAPEVAELRNDIAALDSLISEGIAQLREELTNQVAALKARLVQVSK